MSEESTGGEGGAPEGGAPEGTFTEGPWQGISTEHEGYIQDKGWGSSADLLKSYQNLEALKGVPETALVRIPDNLDDTEAWGGVYSKLGRPETSAEYQFETPEGSNEDFVKWGKDVFHEAGLNNRQATQVAKAYADFEQKRMAEYKESVEQYQANADQELRKAWGDEYDSRWKLVDKTVEEFGIKPEMVTALRDAGFGPDFARVMEKVGMTAGESRYLDDASGQDTNTFGMTPQQAASRLNQLNSDPEWVAAFMDKNNPGHNNAVRKKTELAKIAFPEV